MRIVVAVGLAVLLSACQTTSYQGDENSPYYVVPAGSRLILNQNIKIDPDQVGLYIQYGEVRRSFRDVDKYDPFCKFELFDRVQSARTVVPDEISVIKAVQEQSYDKFTQAGAWQFAAVSTRQLAQSGGFDQGGPSLRFFNVQMDLHSAKQPEVFRMTCGRWSAYPSLEHLSIAEIRSTLKPLFTLRLPDNR